MKAAPPVWLMEPILELPSELINSWDLRTVGVGEGPAVQRARVQKLAFLFGAAPCDDERVAQAVEVLSGAIPGLRILTGDEALLAQSERENDRPAGRPKTWGYMESRRLIETVDWLKRDRGLATDAEALRVVADSLSKEARRAGGPSAPKLRSLQTLLSRARKLHAEPSSTK